MLRSLQQLRAGLGGRQTLAFLLTDGQERDDVPDRLARAAELALELHSERVRLVVIAVGEADVELLGRLAGGAERVLRGDSLEDLRSIFRREILGARVAEGDAQAPRLAPRAAGSLAAEVAALGPAAAPLPPLERYVRAVLRPGAEVLWESANGEALLGLARVGLGRTALFASLPVPGWAGAWSARADAQGPAEFDSLLRWLARGPQGETFALRASLANGELELTGVDETWPARLPAEVRDARDGALLARLELMPPSALGQDALRRRSVPFPEAPQSEDLALVVTPPQTGASEIALAVERGLADEFARREHPLGAPWTGAAVAAHASGARASSSHPAATWTLGLGLALFFAAALAGGGAARGQGERGNVR